MTVSDPRHSVYIYNCSGSVVQVRRQALCERTQVIHRALYANPRGMFCQFRAGWYPSRVCCKPNRTVFCWACNIRGRGTQPAVN